MIFNIIAIISFLCVPIAHSSDLTIIYSGSTNGVLESCSCPGNPYGGLVNRAAAIDSLKQIYPDALVFDTGDFLPVTVDSLKATYVIKALHACNIDAIVAGDQDFNLGSAFIENAGLPFVSASLFNPNSNGYYFPTYKLFRVDSIDIAVTSLTLPSAFAFYPDSIKSQVGVEPPQFTWKRYGPLLQDKADVVIVLSHMGYYDDQKFIEAHDDIDILISGHSQVLLTKPEQIGKTIVVAPGKNGENLGVLHVKFDSLNNITNYDNVMIPLIADSVGESDTVRAMIDEYNLLLKEQKRIQAIAAGRKFYGTPFCAECHPDQFQSWQLTEHAHALNTLEEKDQAENPSCLECHTTGYGYPGGFVSATETAAMAGIGCEECHRIPANVEFDLDSGHKVMPVISKWCTRCHKKPHIIEFDFETMKEKVDHNE